MLFPSQHTDQSALMLRGEQQPARDPSDDAQVFVSVLGFTSYRPLLTSKRATSGEYNHCGLFSTKYGMLHDFKWDTASQAFPLAIFLAFCVASQPCFVLENTDLKRNSPRQLACHTKKGQLL
jgi:hypothetical protein